MSVRLPSMPKIPPELLRKGAIPAVFIAALTGPVAHGHLERWEGNILHVYADKLARGIPTYCAGRTDWSAKVGTKLTDDQCREVNKVTLLEYGYAVLACVDWQHLNENRLISLTMFAVNVGKAAACNSQTVKHINRGQIEAGCRLIARTPDGRPNWSSANGVYVQGLQNRRQAEAALCLDKTPVKAVTYQFRGVTKMLVSSASQLKTGGRPLILHQSWSVKA